MLKGNNFSFPGTRTDGFSPSARVVYWLIVGVNVATPYALIVHHEPRHLCFFAAVTTATLLFAWFAIRRIIWSHMWSFIVAAVAVFFAGGLCVVAVFSLGVYTNDATCLRAGLLLAVATVAVSGLLALVAKFFHRLTYGGPGGVIPVRVDATVPTSEDAASEANRLIAEEYEFQQQRGESNR